MAPEDMSHIFLINNKDNECISQDRLDYAIITNNTKNLSGLK